MSIRRILSGAVAGAVALTTLASLPAQAANATAADSWADFQKPDAWIAQADSLHWYVQSPVITRAMVGKPVKFTVASTATIDCKTIASGFVAGNSWTNAAVSTRSCTATRVTAAMKATRSMVGNRVSVIGWSAVPGRTATVTGTVVALDRASRTVSTASRTDAPQPVGTLKSLGTTDDGQQVATSSDNSVNEVWVGSTRYAAPTGEITWAGYADGQVHLLVRKGPKQLIAWTLATGTGKVTEVAVPDSTQAPSDVMTVVEANPYGFIVKAGDFMAFGGAYDWNVTLRAANYARPSRVIGLTGDYVVFSPSGQTVTQLQLVELSTGTVAATSSTHVMSGYTVDRTTPAVDFTFSGGSCRLTPSGETCTAA